jgi:hypothetical protein
MVRVEVVFCGVSPQPAYGRLAVLDLGREDGVLAEPIVDARCGISLASQPYGGAVILVAGLPGPAMNPDDNRKPSSRLLGQIEVEPVPLVPILDVGKSRRALTPCGSCLGGCPAAGFATASVAASPSTKMGFEFIFRLS